MLIFICFDLIECGVDDKSQKHLLGRNVLQVERIFKPKSCVSNDKANFVTVRAYMV